jgi:hypothetical protein
MHTVVIISVLIAGVVGNAAEAQVSCSEAELAGFTSARYTGDFNGIFNTTAACQAKFGPDTRMCTSNDVMNTLNIPGGMSGEAWVRPVSVDGTVDASGISSVSGLNCTLWNSSSGSASGLVTNGNGWFWVRACDSHLAVACCTVTQAHVSPTPVGGQFAGATFFVLLVSGASLLWTRRQAAGQVATGLDAETDF